MPYVSVNLDTDLHVKASKFANGVGVDLGELCARALGYALAGLYPDHDLPYPPGHPEQGLPPFNPTIDNSLPEGEVPVDPEYGVEEGEGGKPDQELPDVNPNPNPDVDVDKDGPRPGQGLPGTPAPKR